MIIHYGTHHEPIKTTKALKQELFNTLRPRQNRRHFADDVFKCNFLNGTVYWHVVKPFVGPDDRYMYSRTYEVKSHCQFTHYGQRKHLGNVICMHMALQISPCTCSIFHAPPWNRNVHKCAHCFKKVVIKYWTYESWDLRYGSTVYSSQYTSVQSGVFSVWFIH